MLLPPLNPTQSWNAQRPRLVRLMVLCLFAFIVSSAKADLNQKQIRKLITRMPGFELPNSSLRIKSVSATGAASADVTAEIRAVFKFEKDKQGSWRVAQVRTRPEQWEDIALIARAFGKPVETPNCDSLDPPFRGALAVDPSVKRARCLLRELLGVQVPSDAVRIQEVAPFSIPLAPQPSALVIAWLRLDARLLTGKKGWHVVELRIGSHEWVKLEPLIAMLNEVKQEQARTELELVAKALEMFRGARGFYVVSEKHEVAIDHLNPHYLAQIIRVDPWHQPYKYEGQRDRFTLRSSGPDGKDNTADDITLTGPAR
jgi:Type II secretion system (T2SS), protein G